MIAKWRTREELVHESVTLAKQGQSRRAIARALGVSRNAIRGLLDAHEAGRETGHVAIEQRRSRAPRAAKIDAWKPRVAELMKRFDNSRDAVITELATIDLLIVDDFALEPTDSR